ncbi:sodium channel subunit beta-1-like [Scyliorhinus canicula]|uniref:sodium channel subunit beta-1-like n=1 Tax=Scyliorhinus canicula TaxID=7830 RepID=UPI0018F29779|nr:sodium channel subunit beta-1-like [Scyliorhinus canicula]
MDVLKKALLYAALCLFWADCSNPGCVEVESDTEAVKDHTMKLRCISCKKRGETEAKTVTEWVFRRWKNESFHKIYEHAFPDVDITYGNFENRIKWFGTKKSEDIQEATIILHNVSFSDAGTYRCYFNRTFYYRSGEFILFTQVNKTIELTVVAKENRKLASIIGEIMMYFLNVVLTLWLFAEMLYCYKKIAAAGEEAIQENASDYLAITSESKENCTGVQVED